jgi:hypothetical protein
MLRAMMQFLTHRHTVSSVTFAELKGKFPNDQDKRHFFSGFDAVFLQTGSDSLEPPPGVAERIVTFPPMFFYGFHPDLVYARVNGRILQGPLQDYHSSIVLWGFVNGLTPDRIVSLFRRSTYEVLGFFGMFEESVTHYLDLARAEGFEMHPHLAGWLRRGAFMHTVNHPKSYVLRDVAWELLNRFDAKAAAEAAGRDVSDLMPDFLANAANFPVYPELGLRLGVRGDYLFKPAEAHRRLSLEEFVLASYAAYGAIDRNQIDCPRLKDDRYSRLLDLG